MGAIITLTTDFGMSDSYVAAMKAVILGINPGATVVDICHTLPPQNIKQAAFVIGSIYKTFPKETIHIVVVDPGVGSNRRAVLVRTPIANFVVPDNGILSYVLADSKARIISKNQAKTGENIQAFSLTKKRFWRKPVSPTFHARDIFSPVAARLSLGEPPQSFGDKINTLTVFPVPRPQKMAGGNIWGQVIHVDNFGNLITDIRDTDLPRRRENLLVSIAGKHIDGISRTYSEQPGLLALVGGSGYLEISLQNGSAGDFLGVGVGDQVKVVHQE